MKSVGFVNSRGNASVSLWLAVDMDRTWLAPDSELKCLMS